MAYFETPDDDDFVQARRQESKAHNLVGYYESQAMQQKLQLDELLHYKDECVNNFNEAKKMGLLPSYVREFKLLMSYINSEIDTMAYKVDVSQISLEKAQDVWQEKNQHFEIVKEEVKQKIELKREAAKIKAAKDKAAKDEAIKEREMKKYTVQTTRPPNNFKKL